MFITFYKFYATVTVVSTGEKKTLIIEKNEGYMTKEEIEERLKELSYIKIHPREQEENKLLLSRGERIYEESIGETRNKVAKLLEWFEEILDKQDRREIEEAAKEVKKYLDDLDDERDF